MTRIKKKFRREDKSEEKSEEKRRLELEMSDDHSDGEGSVGHEADFVDTTEDIEVGQRPQEVDVEQDRPREDIRSPSGAVAPSEAALGQEEWHRFKPQNGARSKWHRHGLPLLIISEPRSPVTGVTVNLGGSGVDLRILGATAAIFLDFHSADGMPGL